MDYQELYKKFNYYLQACSNEEELREMFSLRILPSLGIPDSRITHIRHEYSVLNGRIDSLYGSAILEFKSPGEIPTYSTSAKFIEYKTQVTNHIKGVSNKNNIDISTIIAIIFDGKRIAYQYIVDGNEITFGPYELNEALFKNLLDRLTYGLTLPKAMTSRNLIDDFGLNSLICVPFIRELYWTILKSKSKRTKLLFEQWKVYFREICGYNFIAQKNLRRISELDYAIDNPNIEALIFSIHTYYSIVLSLLAVKIGNTLSSKFDSEYWLSELSASAEDKFSKALEQIFANRPFEDVGFTNLIEPTFFNWFISEDNSSIIEHFRDTVSAISEYSTITLKLNDIGESDILKDLYQSLSPRELRHALGEFYTPDWLANLVLDRTGYEGSYGSNVLDPTCGSGTFLIQAISRYKERNNHLPKDKVVNGIISNIRGIDLNPLAVGTSKINYLIAIGEEYLRSVEPQSLEIPVYLSDAMLAPLEHKYESGSSYVIPTKVVNFTLNKEFVNDSRFLKTMSLLQDSIKNNWSFNEFKGLSKSQLGWNEQYIEELTRELYLKLRDLENRGLNGIWANIIRNFFAPTFLSKVDYIIGNPPWINWENLPEGYRESIKKYWSEYAYNLFRHKGLAARLGSAHDDLCVLLTYIVADMFLKNDGKIGFLLPQTLFKSKGGGDGFRSFKIENNFSFKVLTVDDLADVKPFDSENKTAVFAAVKNGETQYPVVYYKWSKGSGIKISNKYTLEVVKGLLAIEEQVALPIDGTHIRSPWITGEKSTVFKLRQLVGDSGYRARKGVDTSLNAVFWVKVLDKKGNLSLVQNCQTATRSEVRQKKLWIETDSLYPVLRGRDFNRWSYNILYSFSQ